MRTILIFSALLLATPALHHAQTARGAADDERARISAERDRQTAEKELEIARRQLSEAARKLAVAQRKLADKQVKNVQRRVVVMEGRPRLGVVVRTTPNGATDALGALIQAVSPGSPAAAAGLRAEDIITTFNGEPLAPPGAPLDDEDSLPAGRLVELAGELKEGENVKLGFLRGGKLLNASLTVHAQPGSRRVRIVTTGEGDDHEIDLDELQLPEMAELPELPEMPGMIVMRPPGRVFDIDLVPMGPDLAGYFGAERGLLVVRAPDGNRLKLKAGDVILKINGREPAGPPEAVRMLRGPGAPIKLDILRKKARQSLEIPLPSSTPKAPKSPATPQPAAPPRPPTP